MSDKFFIVTEIANFDDECIDPTVNAELFIDSTEASQYLMNKAIEAYEEILEESSYPEDATFQVLFGLEHPFGQIVIRDNANMGVTFIYKISLKEIR